MNSNSKGFQEDNFDETLNQNDLIFKRTGSRFVANGGDEDEDYTDDQMDQVQ